MDHVSSFQRGDSASKNKAQFNLATIISYCSAIVMTAFKQERTERRRQIQCTGGGNQCKYWPDWPTITAAQVPIRLFSALAINCAYLSCSSFCLIFAQSLFLPAVHCLPSLFAPTLSLYFSLSLWQIIIICSVLLVWLICSNWHYSQH